MTKVARKSGGEKNPADRANEEREAMSRSGLSGGRAQAHKKRSKAAGRPAKKKERVKDVGSERPENKVERERKRP